MLTTMDLELLAQAERACEDALTLVEGLQLEELSRSRLTRYEVKRHVLDAGAALEQVSAPARATLSELDFGAWQQATARLQQRATEELQVIWLVLTELVPATIEWLRVHRSNNSEC